MIGAPKLKRCRVTLAGEPNVVLFKGEVHYSTLDNMYGVLIDDMTGILVVDADMVVFEEDV